eukprot:15326602-Ditylum_brightwellii.AAC.1
MTKSNTNLILGENEWFSSRAIQILSDLEVDSSAIAMVDVAVSFKLVKDTIFNSNKKHPNCNNMPLPLHKNPQQPQNQ